MPIHITPREPSAFETLFGETVSIKCILDKLSDANTQHLALRDLGIRINDTLLTVSFKESGFAYTDKDGNRTLIQPYKTTKTFTINLSLPQKPLYPLAIVASNRSFIEDFVNFYGSVTCNTPRGEKRFIPLTGRGTAALEGRQHDAHAGFVMGGACASFQNRCALVLAVAVSCGAGVAALSRLGQEFLKINEDYHGRADLINYTVYCSQTLSRDRVTFAEFLRQLHPVGHWSLILKSITENRALPQAYYNAVLLKLSPSEFQEDREKSLNAVSNITSVKRLFSVEDAVKMLISKNKQTTLEQKLWNNSKTGKFNVRARCGDNFVSSAAKETHLTDLMELLSSSDIKHQRQALLELGIEVIGNQVKIIFHESGSAENIEKISNNHSSSIKSSSITLELSQDANFPVNIQFSNNAFNYDGVNYFASIRIDNKHCIFLPGRGTVALEPYSSVGVSSTWGGAFSGRSACFYTRCALILSVCKCMGATEDQLNQVKEMLLSFDTSFYQKPDLISYFVECLKHDADLMPSYLSLVSFVYDQKSWSQNLRSLLQCGSPHETYFANVTQHLTAQEFEDDQNYFSSFQVDSAEEINESHRKQKPTTESDDKKQITSIDVPLYFFPFRARLGNDFEVDGHKMSLMDVFEKINRANTLSEQCSAFGVKINSNKFCFSFMETGNPYSDQTGDRSCTVPGISCSINMVLPLPKFPNEAKARIEVKVKPFLEGKINYAAVLNAVNSEGFERKVPLVGKGTIAIEGVESGDAHAGLATGPGCASFQNRSALLLSMAFAAGMEEATIRQIYYSLAHINMCFHGRAKSLDYIMYCLLTSAESRKSYFDYFVENVPNSEWNSLVESLLNKNKVCEITLTQVKSKLSQNEQNEDLDAMDTGLHDHILPHHTENFQKSSHDKHGVSTITSFESKHVHFKDENLVENYTSDPNLHVQKKFLNENREKDSIVKQDIANTSHKNEISKQNNFHDMPYNKEKGDILNSDLKDAKTLSEKHSQLLATIARHLNPENIKVRPRIGSKFKNFLGQTFSIYDVVTSFRKKQSEGLSMLGVNIDQASKTFNLIFREEGRPYIEPSGNKSKLGPAKVMQVSYSTRLPSPPPENLDLNISLVPFENDGINFLGRVIFHTALNEYRFIPLVGRGTIALEGKASGDSHCTVCMTGYSATFQQRIALCFASLAACGGTSQDLDDLSIVLKPINDFYHGRDELFFYSLQCSKKPASLVPSYLKFMTHLNQIEAERPANLYAMLKYGHASREYYAQLIDEMSQEEITQDQTSTVKR